MIIATEKEMELITESSVNDFSNYSPKKFSRQTDRGKRIKEDVENRGVISAFFEDKEDERANMDFGAYNIYISVR